MRREAIGQQRAARQRIDEAGERGRLFVEQREVARAAQQRLQHRQRTAQREPGFGGGGDAGQQRRHHPVEPGAGDVGQLAHAGRTREVAQRQIRRTGLGETGVLQRAGLGVVADRAVVGAQRAPVGHQRVRTQRFAARGEQRRELGAHPVAMRLQGDRQRVPVSETEPERQSFAILRVRRQALGLGVAQHLQPVLQQAQEAVGIEQRRARLGGQMPGIAQGSQRRLQTTFAQRGLAATADQLQRLGEEFDLADAARAALEIIGHVATRDLGGDAGLHLAQAVERAVVEIAPVDERPQRVEEARAGVEIARHRPRLLPGVALPVAALALEVLLHRRETQGDAPGVAERPQAQVDAVAEALRRGLVQQLRQLLAEPGEIVLGRQRARAVALAVAGVGVDEVDIGAEVELTAAELAQREHHQSHRRAVGVADAAETPRELGLQRVQRAAQAGFGQRAGPGERVVERVQPVHVAPDQPDGFRLPMAAQQRGPLAAVLRRKYRGGCRHGAVVGQQPRQQGGLSHAGFEREVAGPQQRAQPQLIRRDQGRMHRPQAGQSALEGALVQGIGWRIGRGAGSGRERRHASILASRTAYHVDRPRGTALDHKKSPPRSNR